MLHHPTRDHVLWQVNMPAGKPNKHELRTRQTRDLLLNAAETIFVRDGYERAELGEIASLAGRTKGAIYAQFKSKEEIFLALIRKKRDGYRTQMIAALTACNGPAQALKTFRKLYIEQINDRGWLLLHLEFKLFAIRHPDSRTRLQEYYEESLPGDREEYYASLLGPAARGKNAISRSAAIQAFQPILSALAVEATYGSGVLDHKTQLKIAERLFDALFNLPPEAS